MDAASTSYFGSDSMMRRVHSERVIALAGPRALLLMAAHPVAFEGFFASTGALDDPYARLQRTSDVLDTIAWRSRDEAERVTRRVRAMHRKVRGTLPEAAGRFPAGTPYRADDPELLLWIWAALVDSSLLVYERYVGSLSLNQRDRYWEDMKVMGRLFGIPDSHLPSTIDDFDAYVRDMLASGDLVVTDRARELGIDIVMHPPVPLHIRPLVELSNFITVGLLPPDVRRGYKLSWDPARGLARHVGAEYVKRVLVPLLPSSLRLIPSARTA